MNVYIVQEQSEKETYHMYTTTCLKTAESIQWWLNVYECEDSLKDGYGMDIIIYSIESSFKAEVDACDIMNGIDGATVIERA